MDTVYLMDSQTKEKAKSAKLISFIALAVAGIYAIEGVFSVIFALIPIPIIGFFISIALTIVEFCLLIGAVILIVCAVVKAIRTKKALCNIADCTELQEARADVRLAEILSYVAIGITAVSFCVLSVLNLFELILSFI